MSIPNRPYNTLIVVASTTVAVICRLAFDRLVGQAHAFLIPFFVPVVLGSLFGGTRWGLVATSLNAAIIAFFFSPHDRSFAVVAFEDGLRIGSFVVIGAVLSVFAGGVRYYRKRAEDSFRQSNHVLETRVIERTKDLLSSEEQFRSAFDHAPIGMALVAPNGKWLRVNRSLCDMIGYQEAELLSTDFQTITHPDDLDDDLEFVRQLIAGVHSTYQMEKRYFHKKGHVVQVLLSVSLVRDTLGSPRHFISQIVDITQRMHTERLLAARDSLLRQFIKHSPAAIAMFDRDMRYVQASDRWLADYHLGMRDIIGLSHYEVFSDIPDRWKAIHNQVLAGAVEHCVEDPFHRADGTTEWLQWECRPWHAAGGEVGGLIMFTQVITERKRAEAALRASEERFRVLFEQSSDAHLIFTEDGGIIDCNPAAVAMLRCPDKSALLRMHPAELSPELQPDGRRSMEKCVEMDATARRDGYHRFDWEHRRLDGEVFPCEVTLTPVSLDGKSVLLVVWHELTERKRAEAAIRVSEERFRAFMDNSPAIAWIKDEGGRYVYLNRPFEKLHAVRLADWQGKTDFDLWPADLAEELQRNDRATMDSGGVVDRIEQVPNAAGEVRVWRVLKFPVRDGDSRWYVGGTALDVTEEQAARDRIQASLKEKEVLLKEIHHRVKNNLQIVSALLELQSGHTSDRAVLEMFRESQGRVKSMALIHERLYRSGDFAGVDFAVYVKQLADDLYRTYKVSDSDIRLELAVEIPPLPIDIAIPCGLLLNELVSNCLKHAFKDTAVGLIQLSLRQEDKTTVMIVTDDGAGFKSGVDFHNTTSFGLQLVNTLVEQLDGEVDISNGPGTTITVRFPKQKP